VLGIQAVDPVGSAVTPVSAIITPSGNKANVAFAVTTKIPVDVAVLDQGFTIRTVGTPKVTNSSLTRVFNLQNIDNSTTAKFVIELNVPDMIYSPDVSFVYFVTVREQVDQEAVTYESDRVYFTVTSVATPTPKATSSPIPTPTPTTSGPTAAPAASVSPTPISTIQATVLPTLEPLPTTPEFPGVIFVVLLLAAAGAVVVVSRKKVNLVNVRV
jgi:hypothetical protein